MGIDDRRITHGWWSKQGVKCENELGAIEEIGWNKVNAVGIVGWGGKDDSWQSIQVIMILVSCCDTCWHFDDNEIPRPAIPYTH